MRDWAFLEIILTFGIGSAEMEYCAFCGGNGEFPKTRSGVNFIKLVLKSKIGWYGDVSVQFEVVGKYLAVIVPSSESVKSLINMVK